MLSLSGKGEFLQRTWSSLGQGIFVVSASAIVQLAPCPSIGTQVTMKSDSRENRVFPSKEGFAGGTDSRGDHDDGRIKAGARIRVP